MKNLLMELYEQQKKVSIFDNIKDTSKFKFGQIRCITEEEIAINLISPNGEYDGVLAEKVDRVYKVETDNQYEEKMNKLCSLSKLELGATCNVDSNVFDYLLLLALETKKIVAIELVDSGYDDVVGFVEEINMNCLKVKNIDYYGTEDGYSFISLNDITQISYDSQDEQRLLKLWMANQS